MDGLRRGLDHFSRLRAGFNESIFAVDIRQLGSNVDDADIERRTTSNAAVSLRFAHHAPTEARLLARGVDGERSKISAIACEPYKNACEDMSLLSQQKEFSFGHHLLNLFRIGAVGILEKTLHGESAID